MADFLKVSEVLSNLEVKDSMSAAEFGCGAAEFSIQLAKKLDKGRVYALDIQEEKLSALKAKIAHQHVKNILTIKCDLEAEKGSGLQAGRLDVVLITNVLFQAENKDKILQEAVRIVKSGGQILVVDWFEKVKPEEVKAIAHQLSLSLSKEFAAADHHYGLVFIK